MTKTKVNNANFILTKDLETSEVLKSYGFHLINQSNGIWTFVNNPERLAVITFDNKKITYSNKLYI